MAVNSWDNGRFWLGINEEKERPPLTHEITAAFGWMNIKEARTGFSLHARAQSTPRCTRQLNESK